MIARMPTIVQIKPLPRMILPFHETSWVSIRFYEAQVLSCGLVSCEVSRYTRDR